MLPNTGLVFQKMHNALQYHSQLPQSLLILIGVTSSDILGITLKHWSPLCVSFSPQLGTFYSISFGVTHVQNKEFFSFPSFQLTCYWSSPRIMLQIFFLHTRQYDLISHNNGTINWHYLISSFKSIYTEEILIIDCIRISILEI